jgi:hypothetical protein
MCLRRAQSRRRSEQGGADLALSSRAGALQGTANGGVWAAAQDFDREDAEICTARTCQLSVRGNCLSDHRRPRAPESLRLRGPSWFSLLLRDKNLACLLWTAHSGPTGETRAKSGQIKDHQVAVAIRDGLLCPLSRNEPLRLTDHLCLGCDDFHQACGCPGRSGSTTRAAVAPIPAPSNVSHARATSTGSECSPVAASVTISVKA